MGAGRFQQAVGIHLARRDDLQLQGRGNPSVDPGRASRPAPPARCRLHLDMVDPAGALLGQRRVQAGPFVPAPPRRADRVRAGADRPIRSRNRQGVGEAGGRLDHRGDLSTPARRRQRRPPRCRPVPGRWQGSADRGQRPGGDATDPRGGQAFDRLLDRPTERRQGEHRSGNRPPEERAERTRGRHRALAERRRCRRTDGRVVRIEAFLGPPGTFGLRRGDRDAGP